MNLKCIIIDDEPLARKVIKEHIDDIDFLELVGQAESTAKAMRLLSVSQTDLLFLDIQMSKMNGIDFLKNTIELPPVILTTAFPDYAVESYELDVLDYLVKPITFERFFKAATKAKDFIEINKKVSSHKEAEEFNFFFIKCDKRLEKVLFDDILYVEGMSNYVILHTKEKKMITYITMRTIKERLSPNEFIQIHRSYIVSLSKISRLDTNRVSIQDKQLPISKNFKEIVMKTISDRIIKR